MLDTTSGIDLCNECPLPSGSDVTAAGTASGSCAGAAPQHGAGVYLRLAVLAAVQRFTGRAAQCGCTGPREVRLAPQGCTGIHRVAQGPTGPYIRAAARSAPWLPGAAEKLLHPVTGVL